MEGFTLGLALVDAIPVLSFGISMVIIASRFHSPIFMIGASLSVIAGCCKVAWKLILEPSIGVANVLLTSMGFAARKFIATTSFESMLCLILIDVWEWTPLVMLMVYAGLVTIPQDPYESALIDGASRWQTLTKITLPLASSSILIAVLMRLIDLVKNFDIIYATTQGGPNFATENINIYGYLNMFSYYEFGKASAISVLFFMVVMAIGCGFLYIKSKVEVDY